MVTSRTAGILPAFVLSERSQRVRNSFRMLHFQKCIKIKDLKSFRIIHFRENGGGGRRYR